MGTAVPSSTVALDTNTTKDSVEMNPDAEAVSSTETNSSAATANPSSAVRDDGIITELNPNDVLLGRGTGPSNYVGNKTFRELCEERKEEYTAITQYKPKAAIAKEVLQVITERGGRFLKQVEHENEEDKPRTEDEEKYIQVNEKTALEKCKQALREQKKPNKEKRQREDGEVISPMDMADGSAAAGGLSSASPFGVAPVLSGTAGGAPVRFPFGGPQPNMMPPMIPSLLINNQGIPTMQPMNAGSFLFQATQLLQQQHQMEQQLIFNASQLAQFQQALPTNPNTTLAPLATGTFPPDGAMSDPVAWHLAGLSHACQLGVSGGPTNFAAMAATEPEDFKRIQETAMDCSVQFTDANSASRRRSSASIESQTSSIDEKSSTQEVMGSSGEEDAAYALSFLSLSDQPRFTEEEEKLERAKMTDEEHAAVLVDTFGKLCKMNRHKTKKARRDLDRASIDWLITYMRQEIDAIPNEQKNALLIAREKCQPEEFIDARLELFLRCVGMDAKVAAQRFVTYWEGRREVFGDEKFVLPMTLSQALKDDLAAIEAGVYIPLPEKDLSGRQLIYMEPHRNTGKGYTSQSLLRAFWYSMEVATQHNTDISASVVHIVWDKGSTPFDFDRLVWEGYARFLTRAWPLKHAAVHSCCTPRFVVQIIKPILFYMLSKEGRARVIFHGPEPEIPNSLSNYGILRNMIPTWMGGSVVLDPSLWVANRRAVELEMEAI